MTTTKPRPDHPRDYCECRHDRDLHQPTCTGVDSYGIRCTCPSFELWIPGD